MERIEERTAVAEVVAQGAEDIQARLRRGKAHYQEGLYEEALKEFAEIIAVAPGNIETRVWIRRVKEAMTAPEAQMAATSTTGKVKECLWQKMGMVSYRVCPNNYECLSCEFDQQMQERMAKGETQEIEAAMRKFEELPGSERVCRYALKGDVSFRLCARGFRCATCEFDQAMEDALQEKLAKLANRRDALKRKAAR